MVAQPGAMSLMSVGVQLYGHPRIVGYVPPSAFYPRPKVTSAVVCIDVYPNPALELDDREAFFKVVRAGFSTPRKQLRNALANGLRVPPKEALTLLEKAGGCPQQAGGDAAPGGVGHHIPGNASWALPGPSRSGLVPRQALTSQGRLRVQDTPHIQVQTHAKINLCLEVLGRRDDGYHQVAMVLHAIDLADRLTFRPSDSLSLECDVPPVATERNLVMQAARLLQQQTGYALGATMTLEKGIPVASGLGGGSSDAAATLEALNILWDLKLSRARLSELAALLGSDVPFFLEGGCALAEGRGEVLTPLPPITDWWVVILCPLFQIPNKTAHMYAMLTKDDFTDGSATRMLVQSLQDGTAAWETLWRGKNAFERAATIAFPGLELQLQTLLDAGAPFASLTGTGPALYTLAHNQEEASTISSLLKANGHEAYLARLLGPEAE